MNKLICSYAYIAFSVCLAYATPSGPNYPPPGGVTLVQSGNSGTAGGKTYSFSSFDSTQYGTLWWGPQASGIKNVNASASGEMTYSSFDGTSYIWTDSAKWAFTSGNLGNLSLDTRLALTYTGPVSAVTKIAAGIDGTNDPVVQVNGPFTANFIFQVFYNNTWAPVLDFYNSADCTAGCGINTSAAFGFWNTDPAATTSAAPEPRAYGFVLITMLGLASLVRRHLLSR